MIAIKICGITRLSDARVAIRAGANAIGMVFAPSPRRITYSQAKAIVDKLPVYVIKVGVFVDQPLEELLWLVDKLGLDRLQFHGSENSQVLRKFSFTRVIKALRPKKKALLPTQDPAPDAAAYLVDAFKPGVKGGTGLLANWEYAKSLKKFKKTVILSGGLNTNNISEAITKVKPDMVDVSSGVEKSPGIKDTVKLREFIKKVRDF